MYSKHTFNQSKKQIQGLMIILVVHTSASFSKFFFAIGGHFVANDCQISSQSLSDFVGVELARDTHRQWSWEKTRKKQTQTR
jgi:hypothetical protein